MNNLQFCSIITSQWETDEGKLQMTLFALSTEGKVYKYIGSGWIELPMKVLERKNNAFHKD